MKECRTGLFENGLIWFGAGVSIAEILTGTYLAPLGFQKGIAAILLGHLIGCVLLFLAGVIGGNSPPERHGNCENEFWTKGLPFLCSFKCFTVGRMDCHYDL